MTNDELKEIEDRLNNASTGPWTIETGDYTGENWLIGSFFLGTSEDGENYSVHVTTDHVHASEFVGDAKADAEFIAHARTDIQRLLDEIKYLHKILRTL